MTNHESYSIETVDTTLVVQFTQSSLVFPDQLQNLERGLKSPADEPQPRSVIFDFRGVGYISSSVWGAIILLNSLLRESERQLRLCNLTDELQEALDAMRLDQILFVFATREDALADLNN